MQLPKGFKFRGVAPNLSDVNIPRTVKRIAEHLDKLKFREVLSTFELSCGISCSTATIRTVASHPVLTDYRCNPTKEKTIVWGSKRTIAELKKQLEKM